MAIPAGYSLAPNGFFYYTDASGPYAVDQSGTAILIGAVSGGGSGASASEDYLVKTATGNLSAERVVTDSPTVIADWSTAGQVKFQIPGQPQTVNVPVDFKDSVAVATTANITLSGEQTIDDVLTSASRVLVKNQTAGAENGIYVSAAGAWSRATDADISAEVTTGMLVYVESGTVSPDTLYTLTTTGTITLGTTALTFDSINIPFNIFIGKTVAGTAYTGILTDGGKRLNLTNAGTKTITVPPQTGGGGVAYPINTEIEIFNAGAGLATIAPGSGVTLNSEGSVLTVAQYHLVKLKKRANPNTWDVTGVTVSSGGSGTKTYGVFTPMTSQPPASNFATLDTRNSLAVLEFDAAIEESIFWEHIMPEGASLGSGLLIIIKWMGEKERLS